MSDFEKKTTGTKFGITAAKLKPCSHDEDLMIQRYQYSLRLRSQIIFQPTWIGFQKYKVVIVADVANTFQFILNTLKRNKRKVGQVAKVTNFLDITPNQNQNFIYN